MSLKRVAVFSVVAMSLLSIAFFVYYELNLDVQDPQVDLQNSVHIIENKLSEFQHQAQLQFIDPVQEAVRRFRTDTLLKEKDDDDTPLEGEPPIEEEHKPIILGVAEQEPDKVLFEHHEEEHNHEQIGSDREAGKDPVITMDKKQRKALTKRGVLKCGGKDRDSEVIYWKIVPGDVTYESPITPHHGIHHDRYLTFEYDQGGWNNIRMGMEVFIVIAHAMGRTLVLPPAQNLYLLYQKHKGKGDSKAHSEMGFEDFYDFDIIKQQKEMHIISMEEFLETEAKQGGLHGIYPPGNSSHIRAGKLWKYLHDVADVTPKWGGKMVAFPEKAGDFNMKSGKHISPELVEKMKKFGGGRSTVYYEEELINAHHIHFSAGPGYRVLQHHYAFTFFADPSMQSFYKRFVRDFMRYNDDIQCSGADLVDAVRADSRKHNPNNNGDYYALHIRRGDLQFKEVKLSTPDLLRNMHFPNGTLLFPPGSLVYISTDDPEGVCKGCWAEKKPCSSLGPGDRRPVGCPDDPSWKAFVEAGWELRFLHDYLKAGVIDYANPNTYGMAESIVCSRAKAFAGTFRSTFTGYIHRLRGYHGLAESTYYHSTGHLMDAVSDKTIGHGFSREWRYGWVDDELDLI